MSRTTIIKLLLVAVCMLGFNTGVYAAKKVKHTHVVRKVQEQKEPWTFYDYIRVTCKVSCVDHVELMDAAVQASEESGVDYRMILAIARVESAYKPAARNGSNRGLMQVNLRYHRKKFGSASPIDVDENVKVGVGIYKDCLEKHKGNVKKALTCYNGGGTPGYNLKVLKAHKELARLVDLDGLKESRSSPPQVAWSIGNQPSSAALAQ